MIRATSNDRDFWKEELEDKVSDFRNVSRCIVRATGNPDRSQSRTRRGTKKERGREGGAHHMRGPGRSVPNHTHRNPSVFCVQQDQGRVWRCLPNKPSTCLRVLLGAPQNCRVPTEPRLDSTSQWCGEGQRQAQGQAMIVWVGFGHHPRCHQATTGLECGVSEDLFENK